MDQIISLLDQLSFDENPDSIDKLEIESFKKNKKKKKFFIINLEIYFPNVKQKDY